VLALWAERQLSCAYVNFSGRSSSFVAGLARDYSPLPWIVLVSLLIFAIWAVVVHFLGLG